MNRHIDHNDIALLRQAGMNEEDLSHSLAVAERLSISPARLHWLRA